MATKKGEKMKPGWKTTEFWLTVLSNLAVVVGALEGVIPAEKMAIIIAVINGVYGVVRATTKSTEAIKNAGNQGNFK